MENPGYIALSRQMVLRRQMDLLANNLANLTTPGYRGESMLFVEHLKPTQPREKVAFVQDLATVRDLRAGPMSHTGNPLDLAIKGDGYFAVETPEGERYTRAGGFTLDPDGQIVTAKGFPLLNEGGAPITVPPDSGAVTVARDGTVSSDRGELGRVRLVGFGNEQALAKLAGGLYDAKDQEPLPLEQRDIQQGKLEGSNVAGIVEMTKLIGAVRSYQAAANMANQEHQRQRRAIDALAGVRG
ncbi:MAG: flagellar basal-body rod protein FlgF [Rhodospirillales bacterium]|nr:flagellar basal-body rod protein FlgF [Rhodospirillales bacterium]